MLSYSELEDILEEESDNIDDLFSEDSDELVIDLSDDSDLRLIITKDDNLFDLEFAKGNRSIKTSSGTEILCVSSDTPDDLKEQIMDYFEDCIM